MDINREKIIEHIEATFLYLGCANIDTSSMDGAQLNATDRARGAGTGLGMRVAEDNLIEALERELT
jgi:hypothetical protein